MVGPSRDPSPSRKRLTTSFASRHPWTWAPSGKSLLSSRDVNFALYATFILFKRSRMDGNIYYSRNQEILDDIRLVFSNCFQVTLCTVFKDVLLNFALAVQPGGCRGVQMRCEAGKVFRQRTGPSWHDWWEPISQGKSPIWNAFMLSHDLSAICVLTLSFPGAKVQKAPGMRKISTLNIGIGNSSVIFKFVNKYWSSGPDLCTSGSSLTLHPLRIEIYVNKLRYFVSNTLYSWMCCQ